MSEEVQNKIIKIIENLSILLNEESNKKIISSFNNSDFLEENKLKDTLSLFGKLNLMRKNENIEKKVFLFF